MRKAKAECAKAENRIRQLDDIIAQIYEDKVGGELSAERFAKMLEKYEREQTELMAKLDELRPMLERAEEKIQCVDRFMRLVRAYTEIEALTADVLNEFIERIVVGETVVVVPRRFSHWKDEKRQNIRIVYNYIGAVLQEGKAVETTTREKTITAT